MTFFTGLLLTILSVSNAAMAGESWGLKEGTPDLQSAGALAFGPDDVLFVGDTKSAAVFAIATGKTQKDATNAEINVSPGSPAAEQNVSGWNLFAVFLRSRILKSSV
jgi:hypothetical protein